jgi:hypothetical protein
VLKKLVGDEEHWSWALTAALALMRHFSDIRALDGLGDAAYYTVTHGAVELAAEQVLADIRKLEAERGS